MDKRVLIQAMFVIREYYTTGTCADEEVVYAIDLLNKAIADHPSK